jgi:peroxiredoxin
MTAPIQPGERAPQFSLPAINREGVVSDADYRGRALMIGFFRGLHCPFCRRQIAQLGAAQPSLAALGVETVAVINTPVERARPEDFAAARIDPTGELGVPTGRLIAVMK